MARIRVQAYGQHAIMGEVMGDTAVKITPAMIDAGVDVILSDGGVSSGIGFFDPAELASKIFSAMELCRTTEIQQPARIGTLLNQTFMEILAQMANTSKPN